VFAVFQGFITIVFLTPTVTPRLIAGWDLAWPPLVLQPPTNSCLICTFRTKIVVSRVRQDSTSGSSRSTRILSAGQDLRYVSIGLQLQHVSARATSVGCLPNERPRFLFVHPREKVSARYGADIDCRQLPVSVEVTTTRLSVVVQVRIPVC
jgi:hypothetical protein